jgi:D-threo-aldose 1-dehydrogenase
MDPLVRRKVGRTNLEITQLGLGGAGLGDLFDVVEDAHAAPTLPAAWVAGIRSYDIAWVDGRRRHRFAVSPTAGRLCCPPARPASRLP